MAIKSGNDAAAGRPPLGSGPQLRVAWFAAGVAGFPAVAAAYYGGFTVILAGAGIAAGVVGLGAGLVSGGLRWHPVKSYVTTLAVLGAVVLVWSIRASMGWDAAALVLPVVALSAVPAATAAFCLGRFLVRLLHPVGRRLPGRPEA